MSSEPKKRSRPWLWVAALFAVGLVPFLVTLVIVGPMELIGHFLFITHEDTEFSASYTEKEFESLYIGQDVAEVIAALGQPLEEFTLSPHTDWLYTSEPCSEYGTSKKYPNNSFTELSFDEEGLLQSHFGQIAATTKSSIVASSASINIGDGQNSLRLTRAELEALIETRATQYDMRARYGEPQAIHESRAARWLSFSRSPSSNNYYVRSVHVDREGKVCEIRSEKYWD